jgi:hypothetical protein
VCVDFLATSDGSKPCRPSCVDQPAHKSYTRKAARITCGRSDTSRSAHKRAKSDRDDRFCEEGQLEEEHEAAGEERGERRWRGRTAAWRAWVPESPSAARSAEPSVSSSSSHTKALNPSSVVPIHAGWFEFDPLTQLVEVD